MEPVAIPSSTMTAHRPRRSSRGAPISILLGTSFQLSDVRTRLDCVELERTECSGLQHLPVLHPDPTLTDRPHRELGLERDAELSDHDDIERRAQDTGNLEGHRHPAAGQPKHDDIAPTEVCSPDHLSQVTTGIPPIAEPHVDLLGQLLGLSQPRAHH